VALWHFLIVGPLALVVTYLSLRAMLVATGRADAGPRGLLRVLAMLFAWSFVLGALMRWLKL
jgi:hypothetical protein